MLLAPMVLTSNPSSEVLGEANPILARVIAQHDQDVVAGVQPCIVVTLVRDIPAIGRNRPVAVVWPVAAVDIDQVAAFDEGESARIGARLAIHIVPGTP